MTRLEWKSTSEIGKGKETERERETYRKTKTYLKYYWKWETKIESGKVCE